MTEYGALVADLMALSQNSVTLPLEEDEWETRPDTESYGLVSLDFEAGSLDGDGEKLDEAYEGSVDLFSYAQSGAGWIPLIREALTKHCGACWSLNSSQYERETNRFHWEWTFQIGNDEIPEPPKPAQSGTEEPDDGDDGEG